MIYSGVEDNWQRVEIIHSIAKAFYRKTEGSDFRERLKPESRNIFPFDVNAYDSINKERCIVETVMVWSLVTIESAVNHILAEVENDSAEAIEAIRLPTKIMEKRGVKVNRCSDLSRKLLLLNFNGNNIEAIIKISETLSDIRNEIVHDKPFEYIDHGDGNVEIKPFRKNNIDYKAYSYDDLKEFFEKCDVIITFLSEIENNSSISFSTLKFSHLI